MTLLPTQDGTYGAGYQQVMELCRDSACMQSYSLERVLWSRKTCQDNPCDDSDFPMNTEHCLDRFIEAKVGCSSRFQGATAILQECTTLEQLTQWASWTDRVAKLDELSIYNLTGCLGSCETYDYKLTPTSDLTAMASSNAKGLITLMFAFMDGKYEIREQYYAYDMDSFIADAGGYLGLLLGHSIYSIACSLQTPGNLVKKHFLSG